MNAPLHPFWKSYVRWQRARNAALVLGIGSSLAFSMFRVNGSIVGVVWIACFFGAAFFHVPLANFGCPRCHEKFCGVGIHRNPYRRTCANCELQKYADPNTPSLESIN